MKATNKAIHTLFAFKIHFDKWQSKFKLLSFFLIASFAYAITVMIIAREFVIPRLLPSSDGNIEGDPQVYLSIAIKTVARVKELGFYAWELRPDGQGPAGIGSLLYLIVADVYSFVILNAFLFVLSIMFMIAILQFWFSQRHAMLASIPLVLSPYMIVWFSQLNKDVYILAGALIYIYSLLYFNSKRLALNWSATLKTLIFASIGIFLCSLMLPYLNQVILPMTILIFIGFFISQMGIASLYGQVKLLGLTLIICFFLILGGGGAASDETLRGFEDYRFVSSETINSTKVSYQCLSNISAENWKTESWLPDSI